MIYFYDVTTFDTYYSHLGVKNWDTNLKFGMRTTLMCVSYTYNTVFWKFRKFWILEHFFQKNLFFEILEVKIQKFAKSEIAIL